MTDFIFYKDGDEEKGPFVEKKILELYNGAAFTSDVTFQIRSSASDASAPFVSLRDLILKNGPTNPFRNEFEDLDKRIAEKEKELAVLKAIANKKDELERRVAELEKKLEEKMKENNSQTGMKTSSKTSDNNENTKNKTKTLPNLPNIAGLHIKVENLSMDKEKHAFHYRQSLHQQFETQPLNMCTSCGLMLANFKQYLVHTTKSSCALRQDIHDQFQPDFARWAKEDDGRLSMGRRFFKRMSSDEKGCARPQTDFIEDINLKLKKEMKLDPETAMEYIKSDAAKKVKERVERHLREAKGKLVCTRCQVACKTHVHFVIHLTTYDHRLKVKGSPFELISLLLGWFNRACYLKEADASEMDDDIEADPTETLEMHSTVWTKGETSVKSSTRSESVDQDDGKKKEKGNGRQQLEKVEGGGGGGGPLSGLNNFLIDDFSKKIIISCVICNAMYTNLKQFLVHIGSEQHEGNVKKVDQCVSEVMEDERGHAEFLAMFDKELQKWRREDRGKLSGGRKVYGEWSEDERKEARPTEEIIRRISQIVGRTIKKKNNGRYDEYFEKAETYFVDEEATNLMEELKDHLKDGKRFACSPCSFGCNDPSSFLVHAMTYDHVRITQGSVYELPTILIGVHNKELYE